MSTEIDILSDGDGIALLGDPTAIDLFLAMQGLPSKPMDVARFSRRVGEAGAVANAASVVTANSGRWVQLTQQSAELLKHGQLMSGPTGSSARAILVDHAGKTQDILQIVQSPASILLNPAVLAGAGGLMTQMAMQRQIDEIGEYLAIIDAKVDDIIRAQKDAVLADVIGVELVIRDAMDASEHVGHVSDVTWSKVQGTATIIARTQAYALLQIKGLAEKLEKSSGSMADLVEASQSVEATVNDWLAVIARCVQLGDSLSVLELDRVLDGRPEDVDQHREALRISRANRFDAITASTGALLSRIEVTVGIANSKVLFHPSTSRSAVNANRGAATAVAQFYAHVGIGVEREELTARRWREAAADVRDQAVDSAFDARDLAVSVGSAGTDAAGRIASEAAHRAGATSRTLAVGLAYRLKTLRTHDGGGGNDASSSEAS